ncbi:hypothetical protein CBS101457_006305 [Exobasidium rhododendri]|nr:hypothetical protein CBS101457_006305 [Exobasidium rhododendri]
MGKIDVSPEKNRMLEISMTPSTSHGRPLSVIESIASADEYDVRSLASDEDHTAAPSHATMTSSKSQEQLKTQIDELLKIRRTLAPRSLFDLPPGSLQREEYNSIPLKDLPDLLAKYEREKGEALLNEEARPVLLSYVESSPDLVLEPDALHEMIMMLNQARNELIGDLAEESMQVKGEEEVWKKVEKRREPYASASDSDMSNTTEDDEESQHSDESQRPSALTRHRFDLPRSQSERVIQSKEASKSYDTVQLYSRFKTTSDPSAPPPQTRHVSTSDIKDRRERRRSGESNEKDVLRGKGKIRGPPSSWTPRPRPPALIKRDRNRGSSDVGINQSETHVRGEEGDQMRSDVYDEDDAPVSSSGSYRSGLGLGTSASTPPNRPLRQRLSSQPEIRSTLGKDGHSRSSSSASVGFSFPRAKSAFSEEPHETNGESWDHLSSEMNSSTLPKSASLASIPRSISSRAASPGLDETSYHTFSALSPTFNNDYFGVSQSSPSADKSSRISRKSGGADRRRNKDGDEGDETLTIHNDSVVIQARLDALHRTLVEKDRQYDAVQQEHESFIAKLQEDLEENRTLISVKKKEEKESKIRENGHMDTIASLEADLNKSEKMLQSTKEHLIKAKSDYEDQVSETERLRTKMSELQEELRRVLAEEKLQIETARAWDVDRERYRKTIRDLRDKVDEIEAETARLEEREREIRVLKEQIDRLGIELEEMRRGSSLLGPRGRGGSEADNGTMSKRLGAELARQTYNDDTNKGSEEEEEANYSEIEEEQSHDKTVQASRIKVRKSRGSRGEEKAEDSTMTIFAPPTYNEAALEKQVSSRLHPLFSEPTNVDVCDAAYLSAAKKTGIRCTVLEERLKLCEQSFTKDEDVVHVVSSSIVASDTHQAGIISDGLTSQLLQAKDRCVRFCLQVLGPPTSLPAQAGSREVEKRHAMRSYHPEMTQICALVVAISAVWYMWSCIAPMFHGHGSSEIVSDWEVSNALESYKYRIHTSDYYYDQGNPRFWSLWRGSASLGRVPT